MSDHDPALAAAAMYAMEKKTGVLPGYRRPMRTDTGSWGYFDATAAAAGLAVAAHMQGDRIPGVTRLSNGAGSPYAADLQSARHGATLRLAVEFGAPFRRACDVGGVNLAAFPAGTPEEFVAVTTAQRPQTPAGAVTRCGSSGQRCSAVASPAWLRATAARRVATTYTPGEVSGTGSPQRTRPAVVRPAAANASATVVGMR